MTLIRLPSFRTSFREFMTSSGWVGVCRLSVRSSISISPSILMIVDQCRPYTAHHDVSRDGLGQNVEPAYQGDRLLVWKITLSCDVIVRQLCW